MNQYCENYQMLRGFICISSRVEWRFSDTSERKHRLGRKRCAVRRDHVAARMENVEIEGGAMESNGAILPRTVVEWSALWSITGFPSRTCIRTQLSHLMGQVTL